eukprot:PRCOL_00000493-RA
MIKHGVVSLREETKRKGAFKTRMLALALGGSAAREKGVFAHLCAFDKPPKDGRTLDMSAAAASVDVTARFEAIGEVKHPDKHGVTVRSPETGQKFTLRCRDDAERDAWLAAFAKVIRAADRQAQTHAAAGDGPASPRGSEGSAAASASDKHVAGHKSSAKGAGGSGGRARVFGAPLIAAHEQAVAGKSWLVAAFDALRSHGGIDAEGIFRVSAAAPKLKAVLQQYQDNFPAAMPGAADDPIVLADGIKYFLRALKDAPVSEADRKALMDTHRQLKAAGVGIEMATYMREGPIAALRAPSMWIVSELSMFLWEVASRQEHNKMDAKALAACLGPLLLRPPKTLDIDADASQEEIMRVAIADRDGGNDVLHVLIEYAPDIFVSQEDMDRRLEDQAQAAGGVLDTAKEREAVEQARGRVTELQKKLADERAAAEELATAQGDLASAHEQVSALRAEREALDQKVEACEAELKSLAAAAAQSAERAEVARAEIAAAEAELEEARARASSAEVALENARATHSGPDSINSTRLTALREQISEQVALEQRYTSEAEQARAGAAAAGAAAAAVDLLRADLASAERSASAARKAAEEAEAALSDDAAAVEDASAEREVVKEELEAAKRTLAEAEAARSKAAAARVRAAAEMRSLEGEIEALRAEVKSVATSSVKAAEDRANEEDSAIARAAEARAERDALREKLNAARAAATESAESAGAVAAAAQRECGELRAECESMQGEIDAVKRQLAATEGDEGVTSLLAERNLLFAETSKVRAALDAARVKLAERESARERHVAEVRARADAQSKELEEKREELAKLEVSLAESESQAAPATDEGALLGKELSAIAPLIDAASSRAAAAVLELETLRDSVAPRTAALAEARARLSALEAEASSTIAERDACRRARSAAEGELERVQAEIARTDELLLTARVEQESAAAEREAAEQKLRARKEALTYTSERVETARRMRDADLRAAAAAGSPAARASALAAGAAASAAHQSPALRELSERLSHFKARRLQIWASLNKTPVLSSGTPRAPK